MARESKNATPVTNPGYLITTPPKVYIPCEDCGGRITEHDSCECGTTLSDLNEMAAALAELREAW